MRSPRTSRRALKAELEALRGQLSSQAASTPQGAALPEQGEERRELAPPIAAGGFPTKAGVIRPKTLKEAKEILMSLAKW